MNCICRYDVVDGICIMENEGVYTLEFWDWEDYEYDGGIYRI